MNPSFSLTHKQGQAMIEMVVGLVAVLLVLMGLLQIGRFALAHTGVMMAAREQADVYALDGAYHYPSVPPRYIQDWRAGADGVRYSQDDRPISGVPADISTDILAHSHLTDVSRYAGPNALQEVEASSHVSDAFRFVRGRARSERIPVYPILRQLVVRDEWLALEHTVWMPWSEGVSE